eukprot:TRINITY_DN9320_c0_g3_i1.p1 TRINITY_DN9320_c0_g3~~TRINITY_DN9320_c0_g3_i1.p1  ORF type:complete len:306 (-),score=39.63 TRINITY_DN9320_c0_g3_i1:306-1223(-)
MTPKPQNPICNSNNRDIFHINGNECGCYGRVGVWHWRAQIRGRHNKAQTPAIFGQTPSLPLWLPVRHWHQADTLQAGARARPRYLCLTAAFFRQYVNSLKLPLQNVYYGVNVGEKVEVFDCGDVSVMGNTEKDMAVAHANLSEMLISVLADGKGKAFVVGGSNDCSLASARALADASKEWIAIHIDGGLDCNEEIKGIHSDSVYRYIHEMAAEKNGEVLTFGCQTLKVHSDELDFAKSKGGKVLFLRKDIRSKEFEPVKLAEKITLSTGAGIMLNEVLAEAEKAGKSILVSWDVSSLRVLLQLRV